MKIKSLHAKIIAFTTLTLMMPLGIYFGALQYWSWKWDTPRTPLPTNHLNHQYSGFGHYAPSLLSQQAQQSMTKTAHKLQSVSISGAMTVNGELVWAGAVGLANVELLKPATTETQYRIGSVSKSITAVTLMRMVELGLIDLDASIHTYLPHYPRYSSEITVRQLASHMAGVRHYHFDVTKFPPTDSLSNYAYEDANAALVQFKQDSLLFEPGKAFAYSTHGYTLLSAVMQAAGGKKFENLVDELLVSPLALEHTHAEHLLPNTDSLASFYTSDDGLYGITPEQNLSNKVAGGGIVSTPTDLVTLGAALLNNELLSPERFVQMTTPQHLSDGSVNPQYYALGWRHHETSRILDEENKVDVIHHGGVAVGSNAFMLLVPNHNISVAIMTNGQGETSRREIQLLAYQLVSMAIKGGYTVAEKPSASGV